jgi:hypothetical protein
VSLIINKGQSNTIVVTLKEKTTLDPVYYLWEFEHTASKEKKYCVSPDLATSDEIDRFNKFTITETTNPDNTIGQIELSTRDYVYRVYEQSEETNLNPDGLTMVEQGFSSCIDSTTNLNKVYEGGTLTNKVYNG